jgi:hypothetical protein
MNPFTLSEKLANAAYVAALMAMGIWFFWELMMEASR